MLPDGLHERRRLPRARKAENLTGLIDRHRALRSGGALVEQAHRIAQTAVCQPRQKRSRIRLELDALLIGDIIQSAHDILRHDAPEGEALAARQDRGRHLMQLRRRQNEQQVLRRLLDDLEQGVERAQREHMHLVDDIHTLFDLRRGIDGVVAQGADAVHAVIRGGVDLQQEFETIGLKLRYKGINTFNGALEDTYKESYFCRFYNTDVEGNKYIDKRRILPDGTTNKNRDKRYWILENREPP